jgi:nonsense-mediated mRNA decay protein 3
MEVVEGEGEEEPDFPEVKLDELLDDFEELAIENAET